MKILYQVRVGSFVAAIIFSVFCMWAWLIRFYSNYENQVSTHTTNSIFMTAECSAAATYYNYYMMLVSADP